MRRLLQVALLAVAAVLPAAHAQQAAALRADLPPARAWTTRPDTAATELVVLLHGMGRTAFSMGPVEEALRAAGYDVLNIGYSSYCCDVAELGESVRREIEAKRGPQHRRVHFVTHSLGGIIARWILTHEGRPEGASRMVMLAPPNGGARMADRFSPLVGWILEPIDELQTGDSSTVQRLPAVEGVEIGVVAGKEDDTVALVETRLPEAVDHALVPAGHTFIMRRDDVHALVLAFLRDGRFPREAERPSWAAVDSGR